MRTFKHMSAVGNMVLNRMMSASRLLAFRTCSTFSKSPIQVSISDDRSTIVCWHPEQPIQYEDTQPMPVAEVKFADSVLRPEAHEGIADFLKKKDLSKEDLIRLTYIPRYFWIKRNARYLKRHVLHPNPPMDRIGI